MSPIWLNVDSFSDNKIQLGLAAVGAGTAAYLLWKMRWLWKRRSAVVKCHKKRELVAAAIEKVKQSLDKKAVDDEWITGLSTQELLDKLKNEEFLPTQVLKAFQAKAIKENQKYNFISEIIEEAQSWAKQLEGNDKKGPLYGLPVSLKDQMAIKGYDTAIGCSNYVFSPMESDAVLTKVLKDAGAIPFIKTNVPPSMFSFDTWNPIYGHTLNPLNTKRCVGGSSGGEAAAVCSRSSPLGWGSDIGGSIRVPASFCGIYGLMLTPRRISKFSRPESTPGLLACKWGPMANDVKTLALAVQVACDPMSSHDWMVPPVHFRSEIYKGTEPLRIGYYLNDGCFHPSPTAIRGFNKAKQVLLGNGHQLIEWMPSDIGRASVELHFKGMFADKGAENLRDVGYDREEICVSYMTTWLRHPLKTWLFSKLLRPFNSKLADSLTGFLGLNSVDGYHQFTQQIGTWRQQMMVEWKKAGLDVVICPSVPFPTPYKQNVILTELAESYIGIYNLTECPVGVVPVAKVTQQDLQNWAPIFDKDLFHKRIKQESQDALDLPVSVQVVAPPYQEEVCLRVMREIQEGIEIS